MNTENTVHPVDGLLLLAIAVLWAVWTLARALLVPIAALLLTVARWRPEPVTATSPVPPVTPPAPPAVHPLVDVAAAAAAALDSSTVAQLRRMARSAGLPRTLTHAGRRDALLSALAGLEVAACG